MSDINMTPLIDVMLVLMIIFMIAAPLMTAALKLELPPAGEATQGSEVDASLQLALDARGELFWNGEALLRRPNSRPACSGSPGSGPTPQGGAAARNCSCGRPGVGAYT
jgi:biopolymer transport protein ExbD